MIDGYLVSRIAEMEREELVRARGRNAHFSSDSLPSDHDFWLNSASGLWETPGTIVMSAVAKGLARLGKRLSHKPGVAQERPVVTQAAPSLSRRTIY